ncbi:MAG: hypothetical protein JNL98_23765 [Bryobacterales bacterium]|nr:hypothetical protein [Bryobacterales bacterium]
MRLFLAALFLVSLVSAAPPFWEQKPPREWSDEELLRMLTDSPWAQTSEVKAGPDTAVYLASAKPMQEAEAEWLRRYSLKSKAPKPDPTARSEYEQYLQENRGKVIVVALRNPNLQALAAADEVRHMEAESFLKAGRKKLKMTGHFPPAGSDPVLRLIFPRPDGEVKELSFELYLPGVTAPYRQVGFRIKDLVYRGEVSF